MKKKGWFRIPGVQDGDRTLEDQVKAVRPAIAEAKGKTVLDLGAAECLIGLEFAKAGAKHVHCIDAMHGNVEIGRTLAIAAGVARQIGFEVADLNPYIRQAFAKGITQYDIVLALGVTHKLHRPEEGVNFAARSARELVLFRSGTAQKAGIITNKWNSQASCDAHTLMREHGFRMEKTETGPAPWRETVEYWRRA